MTPRNRKISYIRKIHRKIQKNAEWMKNYSKSYRLYFERYKRANLFYEWKEYAPFPLKESWDYATFYALKCLPVKAKKLCGIYW